MMTSKFSTFLKISLISFCLSFIFSCQSDKIPEVGIDWAEWQISKDSCTDYRLENYKKIVNQKDLFTGIKEKEIQSILGKPDQSNLHKRMRKTIYYQLSGISCDSKARFNKYLAFDFESLRRLNAIRIEVSPVSKK